MILPLVLALLVPPLHAAPAPYGVMLLAHGGDSSWNKEIESLRARVDEKVPTETALGMADLKTLQAAVDRLEARGVSKIVAVPLFVQTRSEVLDQTRYALGLADKPSAVLKAAYERMSAAHSGHAAHHGHSMEFTMARVKSREPLVMSRALDDHALVGKILAERAKALSRGTGEERLILVAHGPVDDGVVPVWEGALKNLCGMAAKSGKFLDCTFVLLRDDAAPAIRAAAVADMRERVKRAKTKKGRAVVLPVLIARGGIEMKIVKDLEGLDYAWDGKTLMPHSGFDAWVLESAATAAGAGKP